MHAGTRRRQHQPRQRHTFHRRDAAHQSQRRAQAAGDPRRHVRHEGARTREQLVGVRPLFQHHQQREVRQRRTQGERTADDQPHVSGAHLPPDFLALPGRELPAEQRGAGARECGESSQPSPGAAQGGVVRREDQHAAPLRQQPGDPGRKRGKARRGSPAVQPPAVFLGQGVGGERGQFVQRWPRPQRRGGQFGRRRGHLHLRGPAPREQAGGDRGTDPRARGPRADRLGGAVLAQPCPGGGRRDGGKGVIGGAPFHQAADFGGPDPGGARPSGGRGDRAMLAQPFPSRWRRHGLRVLLRPAEVGDLADHWQADFGPARPGTQTRLGTMRPQPVVGLLLLGGQRPLARHGFPVGRRAQRRVGGFPGLGRHHDLRAGGGRHVVQVAGHHPVDLWRVRQKAVVEEPLFARRVEQRGWVEVGAAPVGVRQGFAVG